LKKQTAILKLKLPILANSDEFEGHAHEQRIENDDEGDGERIIRDQ
jgi:hypothetical protein